MLKVWFLLSRYFTLHPLLAGWCWSNCVCCVYPVTLKFWCVWVGVGIILVLLTQLLSSLSNVLPGEKQIGKGFLPVCEWELSCTHCLVNGTQGLPNQGVTGCTPLAPRGIDCVIPHRGASGKGGMSYCCLNSREGRLGPTAGVSCPGQFCAGSHAGGVGRQEQGSCALWSVLDSSGILCQEAAVLTCIT